MASRLNPLQLQPGMVQYCENMRLDRGVAQTRKGAKRVGDDISLSGDYIQIFSTGTTATLAVDKSVTITRSGSTAKATCSGHGYAMGSLVNIRGATPEDYNGDFYIQNATANTFDFTLTQDPGANASGTIFANRGPILKQVYEGGVFASGIYSSPRLDNANEYIVLAGPGSAYLWRQGASLISKSYPSTDTILSTDEVTILQAFDKLYILRERNESKLRVASVTQTGGTLNALRDVWNYSTTSMLACGDYGTILSYNGKLWTAQVSDTDSHLNSIWAASATAAWAVGHNGTILKWDGATWTPQTSDTTEHLLAVWGTSASHVVAVGANGTILAYNGTSWSPQTSGKTQDLRGVWGTAANNIYAVGDSGTILRWNGTAWIQQASNTTDALNAVWGTGSTNIYAVGASGRIVRVTTGKSATAVASTNILTSTAHGFTAGQQIVFHSLSGGSGLNTLTVYFLLAIDANTFKLSLSLGGPEVDLTTNITASSLLSWAALANPTTDTLNAVWGTGTTNIFAAGNGGRLLRSTDGVAWAALTSNTTSDIYGLRGSATTNIAAVGSGGAIILSVNGTTWTAVVRGLATATTSAPHGYAANQAVRLSGVLDPKELPAGVTTAEAFNGEFIIRAVPSTTTFTYSVPGTTFSTGSGAIFSQRVQPSLVWDGDPDTNFSRVNLGTDAELNNLSYIGMPCTAIATYHNNQVVVARGRDEVLISDVFDGETYDAVLKTFRANAGSSDYIVAIHPFAEQQLIVFCRNSIYLATAVLDADGNLDAANCSLQLLTNEIGCVARRSVVTAGTAVLFLSDRGVHRLDAQFDLKLRGNTKPLSDGISDQLDRVNVNYAHKSASAYFNNRFYLAVPLMGDDKQATIVRNNPATNVATATIAKHGYKAGQFVTISGALQNDYNGTFAIQNVTTNTFDFAVKNLPVSPATGTVLVNKGSTTNNSIFIYSMLNEAWESVDTYDFAIDGFVVATYGNEKRLFCNSQNGRLFLLDESADGYDDTQTGSGTFSYVESTLRSRQYGWQTPSSKRLGKLTASVLTSTDHDIIAIDAITTDPDTDEQVLALSESDYTGPEDYSLKASIRRKANYAEVRYRTERGRPVLRSLTIDAALNSQSQLARTIK